MSDRQTRFCLAVCGGLFFVAASVLAQAPQANQSDGKSSKKTITHSGFQDFSRGTLADGGAHTYVSKSGAVQLIPRWDLNRDGHVDLLIPQDHNPLENVDAFIYWNTEDGFRSLFPPFWRELPAYKFINAVERNRRSMTFLPTFGGGPVKVADLNRDGHLDIVFPNTIHNYTVHMHAYIYWGGTDGYSSRRRTELPTLFGLDVAVDDFNRDGNLDLVFANFGNETGDRWGYKNHLESYLYWGGPEGFSVERRASLETTSAVSCAAGDFNADQWIDLAFANNNLQHKSVSVYWGGADGFGPERRLQVESGNPAIVRAADVNQDGIADLIVGGRDNGAEIHTGSAEFRLIKPLTLPARGVKDVAWADFNRDGFVDLVFAGGSTEGNAAGTQSEIYWGSAMGFDGKRKQELPALWPQAVAAADLNGDQYPDVVFANSRNADTYDVPAYVYWGSAQGFDASHRTDLQGFGAVGVAAADLDRNGKPEVLLMNQMSGKVGSRISSVIFWGNAAHSFSQALDSTLLPTRGPNVSKIADLNDDGYPDLVFTGNPVYLYWGSAEGFRERTELDITPTGVTVGDFNKDGHLDLVFLIWSGDPRQHTYGLVLWGSEKAAYSVENSTRIQLQASRSCCGVSAADLNGDGFLDLVFPAGETPSQMSEIVWGGPQGFGSTRSTLLKTNGVDAPAIADLDGNGSLDLVFPGGLDLATQDPHTSSLIYWGGRQGYSEGNRTELEAFQSQEIMIADLNRDGHLDLVSSNYKAEHTRSLPIFIYWGNERHKYSNQNRTELPAESSCGMQVLDLNQDGWPEIIVHNHIKDGDHTFGAYIYWGGAQGYTIDKRTHLPTMGTHYAFGISPGNQYDRSPHHDYVSPPVSLDAGTSRLTLDWKGDTPHRTSILFEVRTAPQEADLSQAAWKPVKPRAPFALPSGTGAVQYRARLTTPDGGNSPLLREVTLSIE